MYIMPDRVDISYLRRYAGAGIRDRKHSTAMHVFGEKLLNTPAAILQPHGDSADIGKDITLA